MLPAIASSLVLLLIAVLASATSLFISPHNVWKAQSRAEAHQAVHLAVDRFLLDYGVLPESLADMASRVRYAELRKYLPRTDAIAPGGAVSTTPLVHVVRSEDLNDGTIFRRVAVVVLKDGSRDLNSFLSGEHNKCPDETGGDFWTSKTWCGDSTYALWSVITDRRGKGDALTTAYSLQRQTSDKIVVRHRALWAASTSFYNFAFPAGSVATPLRSLVTPLSGAQVGVSPEDCRGQFNWLTTPLSRQGIPLTCSDLYNWYGSPVYYRKINNKQIELTSDTPLLASDNVSPLVLTTNVTIP